MNIFKKLIRIFTIAFSMFGLTGTNSFVPVQSPNNAFVAQRKNAGWNEDYTFYESYNIWDEEWEVGFLGDDGNIIPYDLRRTTYFIPVIPNTTYYQLSPDSAYFGRFAFYDQNKELVLLNAVGVSSQTKTLTSPANARYMRITFGSGYGTTYHYDICINVSDERINGLYFPGGNLYPQREYDELLSSYNTLQENYNNLVTSHQNLQNEYDTLNTNFNNLNSQYQDLQASYNALQTQYNKLQTLYDNLVSTFNQLSGSNAFEVSNLGPFVFVTRDGTTNKLPILQLPNFESTSLGSSLPLIYNADEVKYTYKTPVYFKQGTIVRLSTTHTYSYPVNVKISLYDSDNSLIGEFTITFDFSTVSLTGVYVGSYEFVSDVGNISSIVFTDISSNGELGVTRFELAIDPYQRGYNNGYLVRSGDYYQMLQQYNDEVALYNTLLEEYQAYKNKYNASTEQTAYNNGVNSVGNATGGVLTLIEGVAGVPITILNGLAPFAIWNVPVIQFIITILFFALIIWLVRKFI